jgi:hypothetical protein
MKMDKDYYDAIANISRVARKWIEDNPDKEDAKVQFNYPMGVFLSAVPQDAIEHGMVSVNDAGRELLTAMGAFSDAKDSPSISMIRFALEFMEDIRKEDDKNGTTNPRGTSPA